MIPVNFAVYFFPNLKSNKLKWEESTNVAKHSMNARIQLWDGILSQIKLNH